MAKGHCAVFFSNEVVSSNADGQYRFEQNSDMYYLSGIDQEDCALILCPDHPKPENREILYIRKTNDHIQVWEGWKYSKEEAQAASGVKNIHFIDDFDSHLRVLMPMVGGVYLSINQHDRKALITRTPVHRFARKIRAEYPGHGILRAAPQLEILRATKEPEEITQIRIACGITEKAFRRVLGFVKPGVWEFEIEAEIQHEFLRNRGTGPAYGSIIASGTHACILHYVENNQQCQPDDLLLMDFGVEYGNYGADLSRTIPVSGRFSDRQREVYNACLSVFKQARQLMKPGICIEDYNTEVGKMMEGALLKLKLITKKDIQNQDPAWPAYKKYFMHGTSHFLGLDTHDVGGKFLDFAPGMVLTCEPGIYIPEEKMGVRIENDLLITAEGNEDLMAGIPIEAEEIEDLMNS